jgi:hypothetical protein
MTAGKKLWRNRKERKEWARRLQSEDPGLEVIHPHAAGIDVVYRKFVMRGAFRAKPALVAGFARKMPVFCLSVGA